MDHAEKWWEDAVVYQIWPKSFMDSNGDGRGDLRGIIPKLGYIKDLGADVIWLSPFFKSPGRDNGYDISDYRAVDPIFGSLADFDELLSAVHAHGMRLITDLVVNHTSDRHPWFLAGKKGRGGKYANYYYRRERPNNWRAYFGGPAWTDDGEDGFHLGIFSPYQPDLNWSDPAVRAEVCDIMRFWLDRGVDGFRLDAIHCIGKDPALPDSPDGLPVVNLPCAHDYLRELNEKVISHCDIMTAGEASGLTPDDVALYSGPDRHELDMMIQFSHVELDNDKNGKWNTLRPRVPDMKALFDYWQTQTAGRGRLCLYWNNHDQPRSVSRLGSTDDRYRETSAKMIAVNTFMMRGTPFIYQGEELGMTNAVWHDVSELRDIESINAYREYVDSGRMDKEQMLAAIGAKGRDNARTPMQWDSGRNAGFTTGKPWIKLNENYKYINAAEQTGRPGSVYDFYRELLALRKGSATAVYGSYEPVDEEDPQVFTYRRRLAGDCLLVVCNFSDSVKPSRAPVLTAGQKNVRLLLDNIAGRDIRDLGSLLPYEAAVISSTDGQTGTEAT